MILNNLNVHFSVSYVGRLAGGGLGLGTGICRLVYNVSLFKVVSFKFVSQFRSLIFNPFVQTLTNGELPNWL